MTQATAHCVATRSRMPQRLTSDVHVPSLVLGVAAGCSCTLLLHYGWRAHRRRRTAPPLDAPEAEQTHAREVQSCHMLGHTHPRHGGALLRHLSCQVHLQVIGDLQITSGDADDGNDALRLLRRAETVLDRRSNMLVVLEHCHSAGDRKARSWPCLTAIYETGPCRYGTKGPVIEDSATSPQ